MGIKVPTRFTFMLALTLTLLVASMMMNVGLWHSLSERGETFIKNTVEATKTVFAKKQPLVDEAELDCLATNVYFEAASESDLGKIAVAMVTLNRVNSPKFPKTICGVVYQQSMSPKVKGCQFSWTCDGRSDKIIDQAKYEAIRRLSRDVLLGKDKLVDIVDGALYYHAVYVRPTWAKYVKRVARIDTHIFYKNID